MDQGFTVFVVSWVNPDEAYAGVGMDDYIREGYMRRHRRGALGSPKQKQINAAGYCIAGTTLAADTGAPAEGGRSVGALGHLLHHPHRFRRSAARWACS
ncbi:MAG: hypothetical protein MZV65_02310 [Chromatiales bacterium]|nr:hypothetical protein [Chromatiales bacterium]